jgi:hypothetical protein
MKPMKSRILSTIIPLATVMSVVVFAVAASARNTQQGAKPAGQPAADQVTAAQLDAAINGGQTEEAFRLGALWLKQNPDDVDMLRRLATLSGNEAIKGNNKFIEVGKGYAVRAIGIIEADKKPADMDAASWADYKVRWLPLLYREAGVLSLRTGDKAVAKTRLEKAITLKSPDPAVYAIVGQIHEEEYEKMATQYKTMASGGEKTGLMKKIESQLDVVINYYAQALAIAGDKPEFKQLRTQITSVVEQYYRFRHGSLDGLKQLIEKHKQPATP